MSSETKNRTDENSQTFENFPIQIVILCNLVPLLGYAAGAAILARLSIWAAIPYLLFCAWLEFRLLKTHCVNCAYYGKLCGFGRGKLCAALFKQGDPQKFVPEQFKWTDILPELMLFIVPLVGGIVLLVIDFSWLTVIALAILVALNTVGNATIRGSFACKYCKQRELGCPAEQLFNKTEA